MRSLNFWFDLPSALVGVAFLSSAAFSAWQQLTGAAPQMLPGLEGLGLSTLLGAAFLWMSLTLGRTARLARERRDRWRLSSSAARSSSQPIPARPES